MLKWFLIIGLVISVTPAQSFAPALLHVKVKIVVAEENRKLIWTIVGQDYARSSELQLDGADTPATLFLPDYKNVPGGDYEVSAVVTDTIGNVLQRGRTQVRVIGMQQ